MFHGVFVFLQVCPEVKIFDKHWMMRSGARVCEHTSDQRLYSDLEVDRKQQKISAKLCYTYLPVCQ